MINLRTTMSLFRLYSRRTNPNDLLIEFDSQFYIKRYSDIAAAGVDPLQHYILDGWKELRDPSASFSTSHYLSTYPDVARSGVNPFHHYIRIGRPEGRSAVPGLTKTTQSAHPTVETGLQGEFDRDFYLGRYPDVAAAGIDPLQHYMQYGWKERRDPAAFFSTGYYLDTYPDVAKAGINPFSHYVSTGRAEGRRAGHALGQKANVLAQLKPPRDRVQSVPHLDAEAPLLDAAAIRAAIDAKMANSNRNLIVAIAHDNYGSNGGGTQLAIRTEEAAAIREHYCYLGVWPNQSLALLSNDTDVIFGIRLNRYYIGSARSNDLISSLVLCDIESERLHLVIHHLLGHNPELIAELAQAIGISKGWYWIHDYFGICQSYNLQRNDLVYCAAPPQSSAACGICIYGQDRPAHLDRVRALFNAVAMTVISPSEAALDVWTEGAAFPVHSTVVHPHGELIYQPEFKRPVKVDAVPTDALQSEPVRLAFLGATVAHKGWNEYVELARHLGGMASREFHYIGSYDNIPSNVLKTYANVTSGDPDAMLRAVREAGIDVFVNWPTWPETFSYTTIEALAAGAVVLTNQISGNVAALVRNTGKGRVFSSLEQLASFVGSPGLDRLVIEARAARASGHYSINRSRQTLDLIVPKVAGR